MLPFSQLARPKSIVQIDGTRRATFRVGDRSIALVTRSARARSARSCATR
jgi:hypothetical protein